MNNNFYTLYQSQIKSYKIKIERKILLQYL